MKYIRTKHTIFEVVDENEKVYYVRAKSDPTSIYSKSKCQTDIVKEGETIEELCDEFVVVVGKATKGYIVFNQCLNSFEKVVSLNQKAKQEETLIYGAIWTHNGLKYVAKLNDKGELKLL